MTVAVQNPPAVSLGINTNLASPLPIDKAISQRQWRNDTVKNRYRLQYAAKKLLPGWRVADCMTVPVISGGNVHILRDDETGHAHLKGVNRCGSVWVCPVCSAKIAMVRRAELAEGIARARGEGWQVAFVTYTARHSRDTDLKMMVAATKTALRGLKSGKWWQSNIKALGLEGTIQGTEVTYSNQNGWHVHYHAIMLFSSAVDLEELEQKLYFKWSQVLEKNGLDCDREHGVMVAPGEQASNYISKWGLDSELTQGTEKRGRSGHFTPFQLLGLYLAGHKMSGKLFQIYAAAFKGVSQLRWSRGLRAKLGVGAAVSDREAADLETSEHSTTVGTLSWSDYKKVLNLGGPGVIGELLMVAECGFEGLEVWLKSRFNVDLVYQ